MIIMNSEVLVKNVSGSRLSELLISRTDENYQKWWPGAHLQFRTIKRCPGNSGNLVYFDEYIGKYRLKFTGVVKKYLPGEEIIWQMKKIIILPAWLTLQFHDTPQGALVYHEVSAEFNGIGRLPDPIIRLGLSRTFEPELDQHAHGEFKKLSKMLQALQQHRGYNG